MRQVILIHAHKDLDQLNALIGRMLDEDFLIYVNVDARSPIDVARLHPAARLVWPRIAIGWGDFSQVAAILHSMRQVVAEAGEFDKLVFLRAQDYPLLSNRRFKQELAALAGRELFDCVPIGADGWRCADRYRYFHRDGGGRIERIACGVANRAMRAAGFARGMVNGWQPGGGSAWWTLSRDCVRMIVARGVADPSIARFSRTVDCPDEMFFQTLVMNSPFRDRVVANNFRHIEWSGQAVPHAKMLDAGDFAALRASNSHFCRKLEPAASAGLLRLLREP